MARNRPQTHWSSPSPDTVDTSAPASRAPNDRLFAQPAADVCAFFLGVFLVRPVLRKLREDGDQ